MAPWDIGVSIELDYGRPTDPDMGRIMDPDMVLGSSLGLVVTMVPGGNKGHPDRYGPSGIKDCEPKRGPRRWPRPLESALEGNRSHGQQQRP